MITSILKSKMPHRIAIKMFVKKVKLRVPPTLDSTRSREQAKMRNSSLKIIPVFLASRINNSC
jgi:hypothetical protein